MTTDADKLASSFIDADGRRLLPVIARMVLSDCGGSYKAAFQELIRLDFRLTASTPAGHRDLRPAAGGHALHGSGLVEGHGRARGRGGIPMGGRRPERGGRGVRGRGIILGSHCQELRRPAGAYALMRAQEPVPASPRLSAAAPLQSAAAPGLRCPHCHRDTGHSEALATADASDAALIEAVRNVVDSAKGGSATDGQVLSDRDQRSLDRVSWEALATFGALVSGARGASMQADIPDDIRRLLSEEQTGGRPEKVVDAVRSALRRGALPAKTRSELRNLTSKASQSTVNVAGTVRETLRSGSIPKDSPARGLLEAALAQWEQGVARVTEQAPAAAADPRVPPSTGLNLSSVAPHSQAKQDRTRVPDPACGPSASPNAQRELADVMADRNGRLAAASECSAVCEVCEVKEPMEDVSTQQDLSVMKYVIEEGYFPSQCEYLGTVSIDFIDISVVKGKTKWAAAGEGAEFVVGDDELPPGIEQALEGMWLGELAELEVAQCQLGRWAADGESDPAVFRVRLLQLHGPALLAAVTKRKEQGTVLYKAEQLAQAQRKWAEAVDMIDAGWESATAADQKALAQIKLPCLTDLAAVQFTLKHFRDCISSCSEVLPLDSRNVKAMLLLGRASRECGEDAEARKFFTWILMYGGMPRTASAVWGTPSSEGYLQELESASAAAKQELAKLDRAEKREGVAERKLQEAKEQRKCEEVEQYQKHLDELRSKGRLPQRLTVTTPLDEGCSCVAGDYELDEDGCGIEGEPEWRKGGCRIYFVGLWWMVTNTEAQAAHELRSAYAQGKMPHEVLDWLRADPEVEWRLDTTVTVAVAAP